MDKKEVTKVYALRISESDYDILKRLRKKTVPSHVKGRDFNSLFVHYGSKGIEKHVKGKKNG